LKQHNNAVFTRMHRLTPLAVALILLPACSTNPLGSEQTEPGKKGRILTVISSPAGATVRANGNRLGKTPLDVNIEKSFPRKWVQAEDYGIVYRISGKLTIDKDGCDEYTVPVTPVTPAGDIEVTLTCAEEKPASVPNREVQPAVPESVEQRLKTLDTLYRDGVISIDEYTQHRSRILDEL